MEASSRNSQLLKAITIMGEPKSSAPARAAKGRDREAKQRKERRTFVKQLNKRSTQEDMEIKSLESVIAEGAPAPGTNPLASAAAVDAAAAPGSDAATTGSYATARTFDELPLSEYTKEGLVAAKYTTLTAIQRAALPHAIAGRDVLGAAKTGSGKTLAFLIPVRAGGEDAGRRVKGGELRRPCHACMRARLAPRDTCGLPCWWESVKG